MTDEARIDSWLAAMTLEEKCWLVGGDTTWRTRAVDRLGIPAVKMSDGPNGVRGEFTAGAATRSVLVPVGIAQGATWDPDLIGQVGDLLGREARRKSAHVLLGPAVNLHRTPVGGRTFEYFSEDPELTAAMAVATVRGVQAHDVAVTVKHFVANDTEVDRMSVDVDVDERVLRELYLRPFEVAVTEAGAWGVMSAYNKVDGHFCAANDRLLNQILRAEWGFDGFVVSDWYGSHDAEASANGGLSIEMPGPTHVYGAKLMTAVDEGRVDEATVNALARDVLVLIDRTRAVERSADEPEETVDDPDERALCRRVAVAGTVLARNERDALPLALPLAVPTGASVGITTAGSVGNSAAGPVGNPAAGPVGYSVALIGPNASRTRTMGGGSSSLQPLPQRSILEAFLDRVPGTVHEVGCLIDKYSTLPHADRLVGPDGLPGLEMRFVDGVDTSGKTLYVGRTHSTNIRFFGSVPDGVGPGPSMLVVRGSYIPAVDGTHEAGAIVLGPTTVTMGGVTVVEPGEKITRGEAFYGFGSTEIVSEVEMNAGEPVPIEIVTPMAGTFGGIRLGIREPADPEMVGRAVEIARTADAAIVVVGTTDEWETEGNDRDTIALPGDQDDLVRRVAAVNDRTIVVVNAGAPVAMPWAKDVAAIVLPFFGGMEMADALVDVVTGSADPGGRLPITMPVRLEDAPAWPHYAPVDGMQTYGEGFSIGYRGHDRSGAAPLFPFGHGLSYGAAEWGEATASVDTIDRDGEVVVTLPVTASGDRGATVVVQGYVAPIDPPVDREAKALKVWRKVVVAPGTTADLRLTFGPRAFRRWDTGTGGWTVDPGDYDIVIAASATDIRSTVRVTII